MYAPKFIITHAHPFTGRPKDFLFSIIEANNYKDTTGFLVKVDHELDLAIFRMHREEQSHSLKLSSKKMPIGTKCGILGFSSAILTEKRLDLSVDFKSSYVSESSLSFGSESGEYWYRLDAPKPTAFCGGPVFTEDGEVFGMIASKTPKEDVLFPENIMIFSDCISSLDILAFCQDVKLSHGLRKK